MKIIHVVPYYPPHVGGMENIAKSYCDYQANLGHEVIIFTSKIGIDNEAIKKCMNGCNPRIYYLQTITGKTEFPMFFPSLFLMLLKHADKNTIVHIHCALAFDGDILPLISKIIGFKTIMHIHLNPSNQNIAKSFLVNIYKHIVWRTSFLFTDKILFPTNAYVKEITKYGAKKNKCIVIHNGINITKCYSRDLNKHPNELLFVGRITKQKNVIRLLDAFKLVQERYRSVNLHIVGDGDELVHVKTKIKNENIKNVIMYGSIPTDKISDIYIKCDIFISSSDDESFGNVLLEAMIFGLPIVATDIPAFREVLDDSGILSKPTPKDFARNIIYLMENDNYRKELILKEKERIKEFNLENMIGEVITLYHKIIKDDML